MSNTTPLFNESPVSKNTIVTNLVTICVCLFGCYNLMVGRDYENKQEVAVVKTQLSAVQDERKEIIKKLDKVYELTNQTYMEVKLLRETKADKKYIP